MKGRFSEGVLAATCWEPAGERMEAESGKEGPAGKSLRDLGEGEEGSSAGIGRKNRAASRTERLRKGLEATCGPASTELVAVL